MKIAVRKKQDPVLAMLKDYGIHPERGFLPSPDPLEGLPEEFEGCAPCVLISFTSAGNVALRG
jgi:hypothetical protein